MNISTGVQASGWTEWRADRTDIKWDREWQWVTDVKETAVFWKQTTSQSMRKWSLQAKNKLEVVFKFTMIVRRLVMPTAQCSNERICPLTNSRNSSQLEPVVIKRLKQKTGFLPFVFQIWNTKLRSTDFNYPTLITVGGQALYVCGQTPYNEVNYVEWLGDVWCQHYVSNLAHSRQSRA